MAKTTVHRMVSLCNACRWRSPQAFAAPASSRLTRFRQLGAIRYLIRRLHRSRAGKVAQQAVKDEQTRVNAATKPFDVNQANAFVENWLQNEAAQRQHQNVNGYLQQTAGQFGKNATRLGFKGQSNLGLPLAPKNQGGAFIDALGREYESETEARLARAEHRQPAREALTEANMQHNDPKNYLLEQKARIRRNSMHVLRWAADRVPSFATGVAGNAMTQAAARLTDKLQDTKYKALTMSLTR